MPSFRIRLINSQFESVDEVGFDSLEAARQASICAAVRIVGESIAEGELTSAVEIEILKGEELESRQVVTLSVTELTTGQ